MLVMTIRNDDWSIQSNDFFLETTRFLVHRVLESSTLTIVKRSITCYTNARACPLSIEEKHACY